MEIHKSSPKNYKHFLNACRKAINNLEGYDVDTNSDFWSTVISFNIYDWRGWQDKTFWEKLVETGQLAMNNQDYAIDFDFGNHVYAATHNKGV